MGRKKQKTHRRAKAKKNAEKKHPMSDEPKLGKVAVMNYYTSKLMGMMSTIYSSQDAPESMLMTLMEYHRGITAEMQLLDYLDEPSYEAWMASQSYYLSSPTNNEVQNQIKKNDVKRLTQMEAQLARYRAEAAREHFEYHQPDNVNSSDNKHMESDMGQTSETSKMEADQTANRDVLKEMLADQKNRYNSLLAMIGPSHPQSSNVANPESTESTIKPDALKRLFYEAMLSNKEDVQSQSSSETASVSDDEEAALEQERQELQQAMIEDLETEVSALRLELARKPEGQPQNPGKKNSIEKNTAMLNKKK